MTDAGVGRVLVASLHQGISDLLPTRLEFYEAWFNPVGLREGRIGLAPMAAVLSFLRLEGEPYRLVAGRAGEYAADWTIAELSPLRTRLLQRLPPPVRVRLVMRLVRRLVRSTYSGSRVIVRWHKGGAVADVRGSLFCEVRERVEHPLCEFYAAAIRRAMARFDLEVDVGMDRCRATGGGQCVMSILIRQPGADA